MPIGGVFKGCRNDVIEKCQSILVLFAEQSMTSGGMWKYNMT
jgi:hypothetical protein